MSKPKDDTVVLPTGDVVRWNDWVATDNPPVDLKQYEPPASDEYEKLKDFFFPKKPVRNFSYTADLCKKEGRCPECGELGRIHLSTMICSIHGPY